MKDLQSELREHVLYLLSGGGAHVNFDEAINGLPAQRRGERPAGLEITPWRVLEHMRLAQRDILDFCRNPNYKSPNWPDEYWPKSDAPAPGAWDKSVSLFREDLAAMKKLVRDPKTDLLARILWGDGQTYLREALLVADHNAYHLGQLVTLRRLLGAWK